MNILKIIFLVTTCLVAKSFATFNSTESIFVDRLALVPSFHHIIIKQNISYIIEREIKSNDKYLKQLKNFKIIHTNVTCLNEIPIKIFVETVDTIHFMTSVDHPSRLEIQFAYKLNLKNHKPFPINVKYGYLIKNSKFNSKFEKIHSNSTIQQNNLTIHLISMTFKNVSFVDYRENEGLLTEYFSNVLGNLGIFVSDIEVLNDKEVKVILGLDQEFSQKTHKMIQDTCPTILDNEFEKRTGLMIKPCSFETNEKVFNISNYDSNILRVDLIVSADEPNYSNCSHININFILISIVIFLQIWFLV